MPQKKPPLSQGTGEPVGRVVAKVLATIDQRIAELDKALQSTTNIATRYDIKIRVDEARAIARLIIE